MAACGSSRTAGVHSFEPPSGEHDQGTVGAADRRRLRTTLRAASLTTIAIQPCGDLGRVEANEVAPLHERNAPLGDQPAHVPLLDSQLLGELGDRQQHRQLHDRRGGAGSSPIGAVICLHDPEMRVPNPASATRGWVAAGGAGETSVGGGRGGRGRAPAGGRPGGGGRRTAGTGGRGAGRAVERPERGGEGRAGGCAAAGAAGAHTLCTGVPTRFFVTYGYSNEGVRGRAGAARTGSASQVGQRRRA